MKVWLKAFRLRTLPLSFSSILMGGAIAYSLNYQLGKVDSNFWLIFGLTLATTLYLQILSNLANDYGDAKKGADNENRIGPARSIQSGEISAKAMLNAVILFSILSLISGLALLYFAFQENLNWTSVSFLILGLLATAAAIKYTVGKGAYGYSGLGDLFVFIFFGPVAVMGTFYLLTKHFDWLLILPAITMGCFSVAVLNLNNMRDQVNDKAVGKNTLVVRLGFERAKIYHYCIFAIAYLIFPLPVLFFGTTAFKFISILPIAIIHLIHINKVIKIVEPKDFDPELKKIALSAFLYSLLIWFSLYLEHFL